MHPVDIVNQCYLRFGEDEAACVKEYLQSNVDRQTNRTIKRVAIYNTRLKFGGIGRVISLIIPIYESMNYEVVLITEDVSEKDFEISDSVKRFTIVNSQDIKKGIKSYKERAEELAQILTRERIDVFIHHGVSYPFFVYDIMLAKLLGIYVIAERHQVFTEEFCRLNDLFFRQIETFKMLDKLVVLSNTDVLYWQSLGVDACYIENPFNTALSSLKHDFHGENIVWIGRLENVQKQYMDVLDIAKEVIIRKPCAKFLMYGYGTDKEVECIYSAIREQSLEENVFFCGYETDISKLYMNARIHLVTSAFEAFPMGIYESRICGIPLVMYELPYLELLKEKKGYLAAEYGDISAMAENICRILEDKELEKTLQTDARESVRDCSNDIIRDKWKKLFCEIEQGRKESNKNEEFGTILRTIHRHFSIAQKEYNDLYSDIRRLSWEVEHFKVLYNISKAVEEGKQVVIGPYGKVGKKIKKMINEKGIYETYIVDNALAKDNEQIKSLEEIKDVDCSNLYFVICSSQTEIRQLFYEKYRALTSEGNIIFFDDKVNRTACLKREDR